jgi:hypothetical protein
MVDLAIAQYHAENVARLTKIEDRLIGIDGNGSGRKGAIQRLEDKVDEGFSSAVTQLQEVQKTVTHLTSHSFKEENIPKERVRRAFWGFVAAIGVAAMSFVGAWGVEWIKHIKGW